MENKVSNNKKYWKKLKILIMKAAPSLIIIKERWTQNSL